MGDSSILSPSTGAGLSGPDILRLRREHGENVLPKAKGPTVLSILFSQLKSLVTLVTAGIFVTGLISGKPFLGMHRVSIVLAVAAVPLWQAVPAPRLPGQPRVQEKARRQPGLQLGHLRAEHP